eukprot:scaffold3064_cov63-Phaeocystis_antarctica.AAC.8
MQEAARAAARRASASASLLRWLADDQLSVRPRLRLALPRRLVVFFLRHRHRRRRHGELHGLRLQLRLRQHDLLRRLRLHGGHLQGWLQSGLAGHRRLAGCRRARRVQRGEDRGGALQRG